MDEQHQVSAHPSLIKDRALIKDEICVCVCIKLASPHMMLLSHASPPVCSSLL